jgi:hypothetical protein
MFWALVAEELHKSTILRELPYLSSSPRKYEQRTAPEWPRLPLTRESRATNEHTILPQSAFSFPLYNMIGKATRAHPAFAIFSLYLP